jgi:hypothetical protein
MNICIGPSHLRFQGVCLIYRSLRIPFSPVHLGARQTRDWRLKSLIRVYDVSAHLNSSSYEIDSLLYLNRIAKAVDNKIMTTEMFKFVTVCVNAKEGYV